MYYHSIEDEVPAPNQRMVRVGYVSWVLAATGYCLNFLTLSIAFFGGNAKTNVATWCASAATARVCAALVMHAC